MRAVLGKHGTWRTSEKGGGGVSRSVSGARGGGLHTQGRGHGLPVPSPVHARLPPAKRGRREGLEVFFYCVHPVARLFFFFCETQTGHGTDGGGRTNEIGRCPRFCDFIHESFVEARRCMVSAFRSVPAEQLVWIKATKSSLKQRKQRIYLVWCN